MTDHRIHRRPATSPPPDPMTTPDPSPRTVKVRIAVAVDPTGDWAANGSAVDPEWSHSDHILDTLEPGEARFWITAKLPVPTPVEVEGEVRDA